MTTELTLREVMVQRSGMLPPSQVEDEVGLTDFEHPVSEVCDVFISRDVTSKHYPWDVYVKLLHTFDMPRRVTWFRTRMEAEMFVVHISQHITEI